MTREEAIATAIATLESIKQFGIDKWIFNKKEIEAFDMAIEAMQAMQAKTDGDLISKQDAIRWVKTECNPYGKPTLDFESGKKVIEHLEQMPSAETPTFQQKHQLSEETPTDAPTDLISRADAMGTVQDHFNADGFKGYDDGQKMMDRIKALPSADRPTVELKINCTDFVDWLLEKVLDEEDWNMNYQAYGEIICRKLKKLGVVTVKDGYYIIADDADRPSGEWIKHKGEWTDFDFYPTKYECSQCHYYVDEGYDSIYRPNCGAKMGGNK